ncbi:MAG: PorV/PorQ family protein [Catalinimonas sp.]
MKHLFALGLVLLVTTAGRAQLFPELGGQRVGISGLTFLKNDVSPRSQGMGGAHAALDGDGYAFFTNPAATTDAIGPTLSTSNYFLGDGLHHAFLGGIMPTGGDGTWSFGVTSLTTGWMERRTEFQPQGTGEFFTATNLAVGAGYARRLSDRFQFGLNAKYVLEQLAEYRSHSVLADLGFLYRTDWNDLQFAVVLQNFGPSSRLRGDALPVTFNRTGVNTESFPAPTLFKMSVSAVAYQDENQSLLLAAQLNHPNDNAENIRLGVEYDYQSFVQLRAGYKFNVEGERLPTAGVGVRTRLGRHPLRFDYGLNPTRYLGLLHSVGLQFTLNRAQRSRDDA